MFAPCCILGGLSILSFSKGGLHGTMKAGGWGQGEDSF